MKSKHIFVVHFILIQFVFLIFLTTSVGFLSDVYCVCLLLFLTFKSYLMLYILLQSYSMRIPFILDLIGVLYLLYIVAVYYLF